MKLHGIIFSVALLLGYSGAYAQSGDQSCDSFDQYMNKLKSGRQIDCLAAKERALVNECGKKHNLTVGSNFSIRHKPEGDNSFARLEALKFEGEFGVEARAAVVLYERSVNRFGETFQAEKSCAWSGNNYIMIKSLEERLKELSTINN